MHRLFFFIIASISFFGSLCPICYQCQAALTSIPNSLETLPIQENGRRKPYFVFAEEALRSLSGKTALVLHGRKEEAVELITSFWLEPEKKYTQEPLLFVSSVPLKKILGLPLQQSLFSYDMLVHHAGLQEMIAQAMEERKRDPRKRLRGLLKEAADVGMRLSLFEELNNGSIFRIIPNPQMAGVQWGTLLEPEPWEEASHDSHLLMANNAFSMMQQGWENKNASVFDQGVLQLREALASFNTSNPVPPWKLELEVLIQKIHPFRLAWIFYALSGVLIFFFQKKSHPLKSLDRREARPLLAQGHIVAEEENLMSEKLISNMGEYNTSLLYRFGWFLAGSGFFIQAMGLFLRVIVAGRPPVTNMYESIIWVAFGTILFALIFEKIYHADIFLLGAIPVALVSLILADSQPLILDPSIHPLTPVLRDNFWLTIHVLTITLSYAAFALSLGVAHVILIQVILSKKVTSLMYNYLYRTLQVGILLLATGTILGGVWANYSWGRFWDWDPKETWALITLLGYLFLLHGRLAGRWGGFGLAVGSVIAFLSVVMAWYGVNFVLGAGLHSYGFGNGGFPIVLGFVGLEAAVLACAVTAHYKKSIGRC